MCGRHADLHVGNGLEGGWTGRFIQTLINAGDCSFVDETSTRILSDQGVTSIASTSAGWRCTSVDLDGCLDLVVRHVIIFGYGHGLQRAIIDESQHRTPERLIMAQH